MLSEIGTVLILFAFLIIAKIVTPKAKLHELEKMEIEQGLKDGSIPK